MAKVYPKCKAWSQLKKKLYSKESWDFWAIILSLQNAEKTDKYKATEKEYQSILKYYCVGKKEKNEEFKLMEETAKHYEVYDLFLQTFKSAYEKDTRKLSHGTISLISKSTKDEVLRSDYAKYLAKIRNSLESIKPEYYILGEKDNFESFEKELYHQLRLQDIMLSNGNLLIKTKGKGILNDLCKLSKKCIPSNNPNYYINLAIFIYAKNLEYSIKHIAKKYKKILFDIVKDGDIVCYYISSDSKDNGEKPTFVCRTLSEVLEKIDGKTKPYNKQ